MSCPICRRLVAARAENPAYPFCSERCRLVDLGRWLGEEYRVPADDAVGSTPPPEGKGDR
jgi:endogenous inhibitor of DNA gyrase (YacG/DUF329 family)